MGVFDKKCKYNYIDYTKFTGQPEYPTSELDKLESAMNEGGKVTWTHLHDYKDYHKYNHSSTDQSRLDKMFSESKVILIYRDIRDIIINYILCNNNLICLSSANRHVITVHNNYCHN